MNLQSYFRHPLCTLSKTVDRQRLRQLRALLMQLIAAANDIGLLSSICQNSAKYGDQLNLNRKILHKLTRCNLEFWYRVLPYCQLETQGEVVLLSFLG